MSFKQDILLGDPTVAESEHDVLLLSIKNDPFFLKSILCEAAKRFGDYSWGFRLSQKFRRPKVFGPEQVEILSLEVEHPIRGYGGPAAFVDLVGKYTLPPDYSLFLGRQKHARNFFIEVKPFLNSFGETLRQVKAYREMLNDELREEWFDSRKGEFEYEVIVVSYSDKFHRDFLDEDVLLFTASRNKAETGSIEPLQASL